MTDNTFNNELIGNGRWVVTRRGLFKSAAAAAMAPTLFSLSCAQNAKPFTDGEPIHFGIVTDCHYADADPAGTRHYRKSLAKLSECVELMNAGHTDFLVELGDFKDQNRPPVEAKTLGYIDEIEGIFTRFNGPTYHVLGNHDMDSISKPQFLAHITNTGIEPDRSYYSFDCRGLRGIVLDANFSADGTDYDHGKFDWTDANIPPHELKWLKRELASAPGPVVVFVHQLLDGTDAVSVKNAAEVREVLEGSGKVLIVFQGHHHAGRHRRINGLDYYTLKALVEGPERQDNSYAVVCVNPDLSVAVTGYRKAVSMNFASKPAASRGRSVAMTSSGTC